MRATAVVTGSMSASASASASASVPVTADGTGPASRAPGSTGTASEAAPGTGPLPGTTATTAPSGRAPAPAAPSRSPVGSSRPSADPSRPIRVASVPAGHVYVRHLSPPGGDRVVRLVDPRPCTAPSGSQQWWPPVMLEPGWVDAHAGDFDVFHLHFGFDAQSPAALRALVEALRRNGRPLVHTVHDLVNPHHRDEAEHRAQLDVLVPAADRIITLTPGAAAEIAARWGRTALVLPHPHVVGATGLVRPRPERDTFTVGVHAKSIRPNMDPLPVVRVLADALSELPDAVLRVDCHPEIDDPASHWYAPGVLDELRATAREERLELHVHDYFDDEALHDYLINLDVSVLPYRFGTHSGWLEACHDLGTTVLAPSCGFYAQQRPCLTYGHDRRGLDAVSLREAVRTAHELRPAWRADPADRRAERLRLAREHEALYADLL
ncbi:glycosyltransferase [Streptomyces beigongshangae]|uniref:glycosyltransferase n=1 Tax=Streptomyces beigongshangae TaxID=2841597 RepID=UPI0027DEDF82|nr:glycosyltransferase [Streptomyces sp. REN17]